MAEHSWRDEPRGFFVSIYTAFVLQLSEFTKALQSAGYSINAQKSAVQVLVSVFVATILHLSPTVREAFDGSTYWIAITCVILNDQSMGGVVKKGVLRVLGTVLGACLGLCVMGLADLAVIDYENPRHPIIYALFIPLIAGSNQLLSLKYKELAYMFSMANVTTMLIGLYSFQERFTTENIERAALRASCIIIGVVISSVVSSLVLPVTARALATQQMAKALRTLGSSLSAITALYAASHSGLHASIPINLPGNVANSQQPPPSEASSSSVSVPAESVDSQRGSPPSSPSERRRRLLPNHRNNQTPLFASKLVRTLSSVERSPDVGPLWGKIDAAARDLASAKTNALQTTAEVYLMGGGKTRFPLRAFERVLNEAQALIHCASAAVWGLESTLSTSSPSIPSLASQSDMLIVVANFGSLLEKALFFSAGLVSNDVKPSTPSVHGSTNSSASEAQELVTSLTEAAQALLTKLDAVSDQLDDLDLVDGRVVETLGHMFSSCTGLASLARALVLSSSFFAENAWVGPRGQLRDGEISLSAAVLERLTTLPW